MHTWTGKIFFRSRPLHRIDIHSASLLQTRDALDLITIRDYCNIHKQSHRASIGIDPYQSPAEPMPEWRDRVLTTLLHELIHAYLDIFVNRSYVGHDHIFVTAIGLTGHDLAFELVAERVALLLRRERVMNLEPYGLYQKSVKYEKDTQEEQARKNLTYSRQLSESTGHLDRLSDKFKRLFELCGVTESKEFYQHISSQGFPTF